MWNSFTQHPPKKKGPEYSILCLFLVPFDPECFCMISGPDHEVLCVLFFSSPSPPPPPFFPSRKVMLVSECNKPSEAHILTTG